MLRLWSRVRQLTVAANNSYLGLQQMGQSSQVPGYQLPQSLRHVRLQQIHSSMHSPEYKPIRKLLVANRGDSCESLEGTWYNELGSHMNLKHHEDGTLRGEYVTAVTGESGTSVLRSDISGLSPNAPGSVFGFGVMWNDGASTTVWTGQSHVCNGAAVLITSWVLRSQESSCKDDWKATLIGQDFFTRKPQTPPSGQAHSRNTVLLEKRNLLMSNRQAVADEKPVRPGVSTYEGVWYNELGSKMTLEGMGGFLEGEYATADEPDVTHTVYGTGNNDDVNTTMSFFVAWPHGKSVTGWNTQCHLCGDTNDVETLEAVWLMRHHVSTCDDNWKATLHGTNTFTRQHDTNGRHEKLGINTPGQAGEDTGYFIDEPCTGNAGSLTAGLTVLLLTVLILAEYQTHGQ